MVWLLQVLSNIQTKALTQNRTSLPPGHPLVSQPDQVSCSAIFSTPLISQLMSNSTTIADKVQIVDFCEYYTLFKQGKLVIAQAYIFPLAYLGKMYKLINRQRKKHPELQCKINKTKLSPNQKGKKKGKENSIHQSTRGKS